MSAILSRLAANVGCLVVLLTTTGAAAPDVVDRMMKLDRATSWTQVSATPVGFDTHHPQGMVRIGDDIFVSSVEIKALPRPLQPQVGGYDRDTGEGRGHLFRVGPNGQLLGDLVLGEGAVYHPSGIDFDGKHIWVSVAEYRPNSRSIIYRVNPKTMQADEMFRVADHIGAVTYDKARGALVGVSWGGRNFYRWPLRNGRPASGRKAAAIPNGADYIDYQDCHAAGPQHMLCSGVASYRTATPAPLFALGGLELLSLGDLRPVRQVPVALWTKGGRPMSQNPFFAEATPNGLRVTFMPDDTRSTLYVYDAASE